MSQKLLKPDLSGSTAATAPAVAAYQPCDAAEAAQACAAA